MGGRFSGVGFVVLFGIYLLYSNFEASTLFSNGPQATYHSTLAGMGAFLLAIGVVFAYKNLK